MNIKEFFDKYSNGSEQIILISVIGGGRKGETLLLNNKLEFTGDISWGDDVESPTQDDDIVTAITDIIEYDSLCNDDDFVKSEIDMHPGLTEIGFNLPW